MATATYCKFQKSDGSGEKRFRVVQGTLIPTVSKMQNRQRTLGGRADTQHGPQVRAQVLQVRVLNVASGSDPEGADYGVLADLTNAAGTGFFDLDNPRAAITPRVKYFKHTSTGAGDFVWVELVGQLEIINVAPMLDGSESWHYVTLSLEEVD